MNGTRPPLGGKSLSSLFSEPTPPPASSEGRESTHGKHPQFSLNVVRENGNETGVLYGLLLSAPYFDPSRGIRFVFEGWHIETWDDIQDGVFLVTITGHNLQDISNHIKASTEGRFVLGDNVTAFEVKKIGGDKPGKKSSAASLTE